MTKQGRISMTTRRELIEAIGTRYCDVATSEKKTILDEFVALTGYHRKHATRVLGKASRVEQKAPVRDRLYDEAVRQALIVLWEAGDRICGKRLKPLIPVLITAMERHGHLDLDALVKARLLQISAATINRSLSDARTNIDGKRRHRTEDRLFKRPFFCPRHPEYGRTGAAHSARRA